MKPLRTIGEDICYHVRVQCNNKEFRFETENDFLLYKNILYHYIHKYGFHLYNYVLMHSHVHLIIKIASNFTIDRVMRSINQVFSSRYNRIKKRVGHLWISPYRSSVIDTDGYLLCCLRYLDRNPARAKITPHPKNWRWGGYNFYAYQQADPLITPAPSFLALGDTGKERAKKYRTFVEQIMPTEEAKDKDWIQSKWPRGTRKN